MMVDYANAELALAGIKSIVIHDAVVVCESQANKALAVVKDVAEWHLGFRPRISLKSSKEQVTDTVSLDLITTASLQ